MLRASLVLALLVLGCAFAARLLEARAHDETASAERTVQRLVDADKAQDLSVAAVRVRDFARGDEFLYVRSKGVWRCASTFGAVAEAEQLTTLLGDFTEARGVLRSRDPQRADAYGFADATRFEVSFHGPRVLEDEDEDVLLAFEVGRALKGTSRGRSFVRERGRPEVWEIDRNARTLLERPEESNLPPLLDRRLLGGPWEGRPHGFQAVTIERPNSTIRVRYVELPPERHTPEGIGWTWQVESSTRNGAASPYRALGYTAFALHARYVGFANPRQAEELGLLPYAARVTLEPRQGDAMHLTVGRPTPQGVSYVFHEENKMLLQIDAESARLLAPTLEMLLDTDIANPWELFLGLLSGGPQAR